MPEVANDAANMKTRTEADGDGLVLNGVKPMDPQRGVSEFYVVMAVTDLAPGSRGIPAFMVEKANEEINFGAARRSADSFRPPQTPCTNVRHG